jgi:hypothetical protein
MRGRVPAQALEDDGLEVGHLARVLLGADLLFLVAARRLDLVVELLLDGRVLDQLGHDPLQRGGSRVGPRGEELGTEADQLVVGEPAALLAGELDVEPETELKSTYGELTTTTH